MAPIRCCFDQTAVWHSDAARGPSTPSFNHLVCAGKQRRRHFEVEHPCGLSVNDELELGHLLDRQFPRLRTLEDAAGIVRLTPKNLTTESQLSAVVACKGGWVAIDLRSTVGLASLPRSGRGHPSPGMLAKACSIASDASRSSRSRRKRPVTCRPKGIACSSIPHGMEIAGLVTSVTT